MERKEITRREFLAATFAFGGCRLFAAPLGWNPDKKPNLVMGILSDTHMMTDRFGVKMHSMYSDRYFVPALEYFRDANVDAVVHLGDLSNVGQVDAIKCHADAWHRVFPGDRGVDGRQVARLFITGNHDLDTQISEQRRKEFYPDEAERAKHTFANAAAAHWRNIWGEEYSDVWHRAIKGYHFFAWQWGFDETKAARFVLDHVESCGLSGEKPFFCLSHKRPYAPFRKALRPYGNAVAFFGHLHLSATNWNTIYMYDESVETFPSIQCPPCTAPDWSLPLGKDDFKMNVPVEGIDAVGKGRQGFVVRVYDDMMVIERREFSKGGSLGADWVMPFRKYAPHPFTKGELKKAIGNPQFPDGARLSVKECVASIATGDAANADSDKRKMKKVPAVKVAIPHANGNPDSRVYVYDVVVVGEDPGKKIRKAVYAVGCNMGIGHEPCKGVTALFIPKDELPVGGKLTFAVRPLTSLGTYGKPIAAELKV